jgi:hypothetical protein
VLIFLRQWERRAKNKTYFEKYLPPIGEDRLGVEGPLQGANLASPSGITQIQLSSARFAGFPERDFFLFITLGACGDGMPGGICIPGGNFMPGGICGPPLPERICFITFWAWVNLSTSEFTSETWRPEPFAMRNLLDPFNTFGSVRSTGVID